MTLERRIKECIRAASHLCSSKFRLRVPTLDVVIGDGPPAGGKWITRDYAVILLNPRVGKRLEEGIIHEVVEISYLYTFDSSPERCLIYYPEVSFPDFHFYYLIGEEREGGVTFCTITSRYGKIERRLIVRMQPGTIKKLLLGSRAHCFGTFAGVHYGLGADLEEMKEIIAYYTWREPTRYLCAVNSLLWADHWLHMQSEEELREFLRSKEGASLVDTIGTSLVRAKAYFLLMSLTREKSIKEAEEKLMEILTTEVPSPTEIKAHHWLAAELAQEAKILSYYLPSKIEFRCNPLF